MYDSLPMPDEIKIRFQDMQEDRKNMKIVINELSEHLKATTESLQDHVQKCFKLESDLRILETVVVDVRKELGERDQRIESLVANQECLQRTNKSLRESCAVLECENADLFRSENLLRKELAVMRSAKTFLPECVLVEETLADAEHAHSACNEETAEASPSKKLLLRTPHLGNEDEDEDILEVERIQDRVAKSKVQRVLDSPSPADVLHLPLEYIQVRCLLSSAFLLEFLSSLRMVLWCGEA